MEGIFFEITIIICLASFLVIIFQLLRQPAILAYILTGILLGALGLISFKQNEALQTLGQLGITLLLFMLGLELKLKELRSIGKNAVLIGFLQMWFTFFVSFFILLFLGFSKISVLFTSLALSFSSTIVIVKLLSDKKDLNSLHGKLAIGILLVQDFIAILTIIFLPFGKGSTLFSWQIFSYLFLKIALLFLLILYLSEHVFPYLMHRIARSSESLFLFSLAWVFAFTALVASPLIGFSIEIGGFLAGLALANTHENYQIVAKMRSLRDFFITIFFVTLGLEMGFGGISKVFLQALLLSVVVLFLKPLITMVIAGFFGYRKRTAFLIGVSLGQISEFSFILLFIGQRQGFLTPEAVTMVLLTGIISFSFSPYFIQNGNRLYKRFGKYFSFLLSGSGHLETVSDKKELRGHVILIGGEHMGEAIIESLTGGKDQILVVDFNPDIVKKLQDKGIDSFFGDIADMEIQERAGFQHAKLVISTVSDIEDNLLLIEGLNHTNRRAKIIVMAYELSDAKLLYKEGADYVILPHLAGGRHLAKLLLDQNLEEIKNFKEKDLKYFS